MFHIRCVAYFSPYIIQVAIATFIFLSIAKNKLGKHYNFLYSTNLIKKILNQLFIELVLKKIKLSFTKY